MFISQAKCQVGWSQSIVLESYVYILGPVSGGKVQEYSFRSLVYILGPMSGGKSQSIKVYIPGLMSVWRVPEYVYILGPMSGGKVQEYST